MQPQNPFMKSSPTTVQTLSEGTRCCWLSQTSANIHVFTHSTPTRLCAGETGVGHTGKELQEQLAAPHLPAGGRWGRETFTCFSFPVLKAFTNLKRIQTVRPLHCCIPQATKEKTEKHILHTHTHKLCTGENILFQDHNARLLQKKTGTKKTPRKAQRETEQNHSSTHFCNLSAFRGPHGHICTTKTSTFHQKTKTHACCANIHVHHHACMFTKAMLLCLQSKKKNTELSHTKT